eukprot:1149988-Pelagomonas_calceolata.AAC.4
MTQEQLTSRTAGHSGASWKIHLTLPVWVHKSLCATQSTPICQLLVILNARDSRVRPAPAAAAAAAAAAATATAWERGLETGRRRYGHMSHTLCLTALTVHVSNDDDSQQYNNTCELGDTSLEPSQCNALQGPAVSHCVTIQPVQCPARPC